MKKFLFLFLLLPLLSFGQGTMDFEGVTLPTTYGDGDFTDGGIDYHYNHSRDQDNFPINGNGLLLRRASDSYLEWTVENGVGSLTFDYRKAYTGGSIRQLEVLVNGVQVALTDEFGEGSGEQDDIYTFTQDIDVEGSVTIRIKNEGETSSNRQSVIDNISWTAYDNNGGGVADDQCNQGQEPDETVDGYGILADYSPSYAEDFIVAEGTSLHIKQVEIKIILESLQNVESMNLTFYKDDNGQPGDVYQTFTNLPATSVYEGMFGGYAPLFGIYIDTDIEFVDEGEDTRYWIQPEVVLTVPEALPYWLVTESVEGSPLMKLDDDDGWLMVDASLGGVFTLHCEPVDIPDPVEVACAFGINIVEPITNVKVAGIDNASPADSNEALEDFTDIEGEMAAGGSYEIAVQGFTSGNYTNYIAVFIDWNQNGVLDDEGEVYQIGTIANSTGEDGIEAVGTIEVPADATLGSTQLRVIKNFSGAPDDPCAIYTYGQGEDYTINVVEGDGSTPGAGDACAQEVEIPDEFYNAYGSLHKLEVANDLVIEAGKTFKLESLQMVILKELGSEYNGVRLRYYADAGNQPGTLLGESGVLQPTEEENIEMIQDFYERNLVTIELDDPFTFLGTDTESVAWVSVILDGFTGDSSFMEVSLDLHGTNEVYLLDQEWASGTDLFGEAADGVISFYGECGDIVACDAQPEAGEISGEASFGICPETEFVLTTTGTSATSGLSFQWQQSVDDGATWTDIAGATDPSLQVEEGITEPTSFRLEVTCDESGLSDVTAPVSVALNAPEECGCIPEFGLGCAYGDLIDSFTLVGENDTAIEDLNTGCSPGAYEDHTDMSVDLSQGQTYTASITGPGDAGDAIVIWIDFNNDGEFDQSERVAVLSGVNPDSANDVELIIPEDAELGAHKMRAMVVWIEGGNPDEILACNDSFSFGEAHDYSVNIIENMAVDVNEFAGFHYYPNPMDQEMILKANSPIENLEVYNLIGQRVISMSPNTLETIFDGSKLESGVYLMKVTINGAQKSFKIIKK